jgi:3D (Asp-Asp-Asp) domain-containing protein
LRHSLVICAFSLVIALGASLAGAFVHHDDVPSYMRAVASTPTQERESTSFGVLAKVVREAANPNPAAAAAETPAASATEAAAAPATTATAASEEQRAEVASEATPEVTVQSALVAATPAVTEVPPQASASVVSTSRFQTPVATSTPRPQIAVASQAATATPAAATFGPGARVNATVTFYYCEDTTGGARPGDGGGFCGTMRDGSVVYSGAAACDPAYLGQKFRIEGDPTERVYTCADTGGAIHGQHRDIWFLGNAEGWAWQRVVGTSAVIEILQ